MLTKANLKSIVRLPLNLKSFPFIISCSAGENASRKASVSAEGSSALKAKKAPKAEQAKKIKQSAKESPRRRVSSSGVRAWQKGKKSAQSQSASKDARLEDKQHTKREEQSTLASLTGRQAAHTDNENSAPKYDILDSPPEKLRSGVCNGFLEDFLPKKS